MKSVLAESTTYPIKDGVMLTLRSISRGADMEKAGDREAARKILRD